MIDFTTYYAEIEDILTSSQPELVDSFRAQVQTKKPKEIYLWCSEKMKTMDNHRLQEILVDFYFSVR